MIRAMRPGGEMQANDPDGEPAATSAPAWRRWAYAALAVAGIVSLVAALAPDAYQILGPYPLVDAGIALTAMDAVLPWALVAALLYGADGWAAGRSLLWWGAGALALAAMLELVFQLMFALAPDTVVMAEPPLTVLLAIRYMANLGATAAGFALLAAGLWKGRRAFAMRTAPAGGTLGIGFVGAAGALAIAADLWGAVPIVEGLPPGFLVLGVAGGLGMAAISAALAALALVALRIAPAQAPLPELLIATGATLTMLAWAGAWALPFPLFGTESSAAASAVFGVVRGAALLGVVAISAGFVLAGLAVRVEPRPSQPEVA